MKFGSLKRQQLFLAFTLVCMVAPQAVSGQDAAQSPAAELPMGTVDIALKKPLIPVSKDFKLANGLRVVLSEDHAAPVVSVAIVYDVGARDEIKHRSGFAHLFEHMMFQGSENVPKMEHFKFIESAGGSLNASTHADFTNYFEKLPSNQLELALWLESDRMRSLKVTPEKFANQLETVKEEKRMRVDNQPYAPASIKLEEMAFDNWNNGHPPIGSVEDLEASSIGDVRKFFDTYYAPNNATMAIVGDINSDEAAKLVEKYFATIPRVQLPTRPDLSEPKQTKAKYLKVSDSLAKAPAFWIAWKAPARRDKDFYALNLLQTILSTGESSRLYQRLVKEDQVALQVSCSYDERRGPSLFETFVVYKDGSTPEKVREVVFAELDKVKAAQVSDFELQKAKNQILRALFSSSSHASLQKSLSRAEMLAEYASFFGDPTLIDKDVEAYLKVSKEDIQRVAGDIFSKDSATTVDVVPAPKG